VRFKLKVRKNFCFVNEQW